MRRQALLTNGASLIGQLLKVAVDRGIPVWTEAPLEDLIVEDGRVVGVRTVRDGQPVEVRARQGVLISAGGFAHNREMRQRYGGDQPNEGKWSMSNPGDTGEAIATAMALGAQTALMDEAWWLPSPRTGRFGQSTLDQARQRPRTIYVDADGRRFCNESNSYMEVGKAMYERNRTSRAVPCWLIFDDRYRKRYAHVRSHPGYFPKEMLESGQAEEGGDAGRARRACAASTPTGSPRPSTTSTSTPATASTRTTAAASPPTTGRSATRTARCTRASARSTRRRTTPARCCPATSAPAAASSPTSTPGCSTSSGAADRRPLRHRQQHRHGHGPPLPRTRGEHRQHDGVRLPRGAARRRRHDGGVTVMALLGHRAAAMRTFSSGRGVGVDDERDAVVVQLERPRRLEHAVPRAHAHVPVDLHVEPHT